MTAYIPVKHRDLLDKRAFAHLATLMPGGRPQVTPVWCDFDGKRVRVDPAKGRVKDRNIRRDGRVALSLSDPDDPYRYLEIRGQVVEHRVGCGRSHRPAGTEVSGRGAVFAS